MSNQLTFSPVTRPHKDKYSFVENKETEWGEEGVDRAMNLDLKPRESENSNTAHIADSGTHVLLMPSSAVTESPGDGGSAPLFGTRSLLTTEDATRVAELMSDVLENGNNLSEELLTSSTLLSAEDECRFRALMAEETDHAGNERMNEEEVRVEEL
eukprot:Stramenopile-MAST_4_protein_1967